MKSLFKWAAARWHVNPSLARLDGEVQTLAAGLPVGAAVLDAGAGDCRYRHHFLTQQYESADFGQVSGKAYGQITHVCDLRAIPVPGARYDAVVCTQVLAHVPEPLSVLKEFRRVTKPGGLLLLSCPLFFQENEKPHDYFRYTQFGLRHLLSESGWQIGRIDWVEGYYGTLAYQLGVAALALPLSPTAYGGGVLGFILVPFAAMVKLMAAAACQVFTWLELRHKHTFSGQCINYIVVARAAGLASGPGQTTVAGGQM